MFGWSEGDVAFIGEWGDDKSGSVSEVLVAIPETGVGLFDNTVIDLGVPVVPELFAELEVIQVFDAFDD